jgi:hypothetical protein
VINLERLLSERHYETFNYQSLNPNITLCVGYNIQEPVRAFKMPRFEERVWKCCVRCQGLDLSSYVTSQTVLNTSQGLPRSGLIIWVSLFPEASIPRFAEQGKIIWTSSPWHANWFLWQRVSDAVSNFRSDHAEAILLLHISIAGLLPGLEVFGTGSRFHLWDNPWGLPTCKG